MALPDDVAREIALDCEDGLLTRREALRRLALMGVTGAAAAALLAACGGDDRSTPTTPAAARTAVPATSTAAADEVRFPGPNGELTGVLATAASPRGAVLVIHENKGLTAHIRSIPGRLAADD